MSQRVLEGKVAIVTGASRFAAKWREGRHQLGQGRSGRAERRRGFITPDHSGKKERIRAIEEAAAHASNGHLKVIE